MSEDYTRSLPLKRWTVNPKKIPRSPEDKAAWYKKRGRRCPQGSHKAPGWDSFMPSDKYCVRNCEAWIPERHRGADGSCLVGAKPLTAYAMLTKMVWDEIKRTNAPKPPVITVAKVCGGIWKEASEAQKADLGAMAATALRALGF